MELLHQPGELISDRYRIKGILGQGGIGITYEALDQKSSEQVALKALSLRQMTDWKKLELFEREARILSQLHHPAIPRYLDYIQVDTPQDRCFYIAQQLAPGKSLATLIEMGWRPDESQVRRLAIKILEILVYLQSLTLPVIHRDIKPQNIILHSKGRVFLVDFGAVQDTYHHTVTGGTTVVGTYGYMAPEQFRGQAELSTDLYGLGTTLLFLLTQKSPADLPQRKLKINFRSHVSISSEFADWLEKMLEPAIANRFSSAKEALAVLRGKQILKSNPAQLFRQPQHSRIALLNSKTRLIVEISPVWHTSRSRIFCLLTQLCKMLLPLLLILSILNAVLIFAFTPILQQTTYNLDLHKFILILLNLFILSGVIFLIIFITIGLWSLGNLLFDATSHTSIEIDLNNFRIRWWFLGLCYWKCRGRTKNISQVKLSSIRLPLRKKPITFCVLKSKWRKQWFGLFLTQQEKEWLVKEFETFLVK